MKHSFLSSLLLGLTLLAGAGCSKDKPDATPEPAPAAKAEFSRSFFYPATMARLDTAYAMPVLRAGAAQNANELAISIGTPGSTETLSFRVSAAAIKAGTAGTYTLKSAPDVRLGDANVTYYYNIETSPGTGGYLFFSNANRISGSLEISGYDARRKLLSGRYTVGLAGVYDPTGAPSPNTYPRERCNITLTGTFENVPVQTE